MMVAVSIFAIAMLVGVGALLSLSAANKRAQAINTVMNNVNATVEDMSRAMRTGSAYHCENAIEPQYPPITTVRNCPDAPGGIFLAFEPSGGDPSTSDQVVYRLNGTSIQRSTQAGAPGSWAAMTAPEVTVETMTFYVIGAGKEGTGSQIQPRILISIKGSAVIPGGKTNFTIQSAVTQRLLDLYQ
jgi:type II secretory pathway component PulJ